MFLQLKESTSHEHRELEKILVKELKSIKQPSDYLFLLQKLHAYYAPLETLLSKFIPDELLPDRHERRTCKSLENDIRKLRGEPLAKQPSISHINDLSTAAGALYVYEGSSLGGPVIVDMVTRILPDAREAGTFFTFYGQKGPIYWQALKNHFGCHAEKLDPTKVLAGASQTFITLKEWILLNQS